MLNALYVACLSGGGYISDGAVPAATAAAQRWREITHLLLAATNMAAASLAVGGAGSAALGMAAAKPHVAAAAARQPHHSLRSRDSISTSSRQ